MLEVACVYREPIQLVYNSLNSNNDLRLGSDDWIKVEELHKFLKTFYLATNTVSVQYTPTIFSILVNITVVSKVLAEYTKYFVQRVN